MTETFKTFAIVAAALVMITSWASAQGRMHEDNATDDSGKLRVGEIKAPWHTAPSEHIVSGRDPASFRKEGTMLAGATREIRRIAEDELRERKYALYSGRRFHRTPVGDPAFEEERRTRAGRTGAVGAMVPEKVRVLGWIGWALLSVTVLVVIVAWRRGWFVSFSDRKKTSKHASRAASGTRKSREAEKPLFELVRH